MIFGIGKFSSSWPIALEIAPDGVRMLQLEGRPGQCIASAGARWRSEGYTHEQLLQACRDLLRAGGFEGRDAVTTVGVEDIHVSTVHLRSDSPQTSVTNLSRLAREEGEADFPGCDVIPFAPESNTGAGLGSDAGILAVPRETIQRRKDLLEELGLRTVAVEPEPLALFRPFAQRCRRESDRNLTSVVVHLGLERTLMVVARGDRVVFVKHVPHGQKTLIEATATQLGLSMEDAADLRREVLATQASHVDDAGRIAMPDDEETQRLRWTVHDAIRTEVESLVRDLDLAVRYSLTTFNLSRPDCLKLCGPGACDLSVIHRLEEQTGCVCSVARPLSVVDLHCSGLMIDRRGGMTEWATCLGLSLLPLEQYQQQKDETRRDEMEADMEDALA